MLLILPEEDQPVMEALADLGITVDKDSIFCITTGNGQKLWVCPVKECGRIYPRQSMLKVHILGHFNVRPFRVSMYEYTLLGMCNGQINRTLIYVLCLDHVILAERTVYVLTLLQFTHHSFL
jgi:hypothetical protein